MEPIGIIIFILACCVFYVLLQRYKREHPIVIQPIPKKIEKIMKKSTDTPKGIIDLASKIAKKDNIIEAFEDIKDIRYGKIGASNMKDGITFNKWIKIATVTISGAWDARGFTLEVYPRIKYTTSGRQTLVCLIRNSGSDIEVPYVSLTTHNESEPNTGLIKDVKIVRTAGSGVSNNKVEVWIQFGTNWADTTYVMYYLYNFKTNDVIAEVPQVQLDNPPGGQNWGVNDRYQPDLTEKSAPGGGVEHVIRNSGGNSYTLMGLKNNAGGRAHLFLNSNDRQADGGPSTATLRNDNGELRLQSSSGEGIRVKTNGLVGINNSNPQGTLDVAGDIRLGRWSLRDEGGVLVFRDMVASAGGRDKRYALYPEKYVDVQGIQNTQFYNPSVAWTGGYQAGTFVKPTNESIVRLTGGVSLWWWAGGWGDIYFQFFNQTTGGRYNYSRRQFTNNGYNHVGFPVSVTTVPNELPAGTYALILWGANAGGGITSDINDYINLNVEVVT
jgi:hypothetical protein